MKQKTIKNTVSINGIGLHTGEYSTVKIAPGYPYSGITFFLTGQKKYEKIKTSSLSVIDTTLSTDIGTDLTSVLTIEHLSAAIHALGIDNLEISVSGKEIPILDGSSIMWYNLLKSAWIIEQDADKLFSNIDEQIYTEDDKDNFILIEPYDGLVIDLTIKFDHHLIGKQNFTYDLWNDDFESIASARTFGIMDHIVYAQFKGLLKGGSFDNAIVLDDKGIMNPPLRYKDEFVRHKIIDMLGDIYINGPINCYIRSCCTGHYLNNVVMNKLLKEK